MSKLSATAIIFGLGVLASGICLLVGYTKGYEKRAQEQLVIEAGILTQARAKEQAMQKELDDARKLFIENQIQADLAVANADAELKRLRRSIEYQTKQLKFAQSTPGNDAIVAACWIALDESVQRYVEVAKDADAYVERLRLAQGWANAVNSK